ncbi:hypothetical protein BV210_01785 [Halorientalis sp. IM1011]|uniref:DUF502 domain-containing protein n=1 Tax=Halorientalis sp. IM1011 TaxID=1932360 RepID=UPI00097CC1DF|nr:DUF502 domain-containing protein [Halorientalis sp. IM1011]AQL41520.1 hypothetical protein BV210_01785 [Halorientalis sp. IM1011]
MALPQEADRIERMSPRQRLRSAFLTGFAMTIPLIVTLLVVGFAVNILTNTVNPLVGLVDATFGTGQLPDIVTEALLITAALVFILAIGIVAEQNPTGGSVEETVNQVIFRIPGVGSLYRSFDEMSELLMNSDTESFQEVKLVEFPDRDSYAVAFVTADTPDAIETATEHDGMTTLYLPMAPNPVMGGHVIHVPNDRVFDVDMSVEQGVQSIVTSGVAVEDMDAPSADGTEATAEGQ